MASKEHVELSEFIKKVHQDLRTHSLNVGAKQAWEDHCKKASILKKYADAMKILATNHWTKLSEERGVSESRIEWVVSHCKQYFFLGDLQVELFKEMDLANKHNLSFDGIPDDVFKTNFNSLKLLDVGSCYNPFKVYKIFDVTAIDLCPASEDVMQCDFLESEVKDDGFLKVGCYDVIVFSLLLEYLPSSNQRYLCCKKAYNLLKPTGLLFILTPDSKHATANSKLMKYWRICLSSLGFNRVYYDKLKHLHCMAFKKAYIRALPLRWFQLKNKDETPPEDLLKIPQDSIKASLSVPQVMIESSTGTDHLVNYFSELPQDEAGM